MQEVEAEEEDLTVTHRKHLRFFGIRWRYYRMTLAVLISVCFAVAGILLKMKLPGLVSQHACQVRWNICTHKPQPASPVSL